MPSLPPLHSAQALSYTRPSPQRPPGKTRQHKTRPVNFLVVIPAKLLLLRDLPLAQRHLDVSIFVFAADHEANLAGGVGGDGSVGVFDGGEDFFAGLFEVGDQGEVEPLVFG